MTDIIASYDKLDPRTEFVVMIVAGASRDGTYRVGTDTFDVGGRQARDKFTDLPENICSLRARRLHIRTPGTASSMNPWQVDLCPADDVVQDQAGHNIFRVRAWRDDSSVLDRRLPPIRPIARWLATMLSGQPASPPADRASRNIGFAIMCALRRSRHVGQPCAGDANVRCLGLAFVADPEGRVYPITQPNGSICGHKFAESSRAARWSNQGGVVSCVKSCRNSDNANQQFADACQNGLANFDPVFVNTFVRLSYFDGAVHSDLGYPEELEGSEVEGQ